MAQQVQPRRRVLVAGLTIAGLGSILLCLILGELAIRAVHLLRDDIPFFESPARIGPITMDSKLGWRATEHYGQDLEEHTLRGQPYHVHRTQGLLGFRTYGDLRSTKPKMLVIGDSFTHAMAVSNDRTYYALLSDLLGVETFAYGTGGYGTLQEYLLLDEVFDTIRPTMVLWQFCSNDFINNDHALEMASSLNNNGWIRPYWENGRPVLRSPKPSGVQAREWIQRHSRFLYFIVSRVDRLRARGPFESIEFQIDRARFAHPGFARSVQTTDELMGIVRRRIGNVPLYAFNCDRDEPYSTAFEQISSHHQIQFWKDVPDAVRNAEANGLDVSASDAHWNELGHALIAKSLNEHFRRLQQVSTQ